MTKRELIHIVPPLIPSNDINELPNLVAWKINVYWRLREHELSENLSLDHCTETVVNGLMQLLNLVGDFFRNSDAHIGISILHAAPGFAGKAYRPNLENPRDVQRT